MSCCLCNITRPFEHGLAFTTINNSPSAAYVCCSWLISNSLFELDGKKTKLQNRLLENSELVFYSRNKSEDPNM